MNREQAELRAQEDHAVIYEKYKAAMAKPDNERTELEERIIGAYQLLVSIIMSIKVEE